MAKVSSPIKASGSFIQRDKDLAQSIGAHAHV